MVAATPVIEPVEVLRATEPSSWDLAVTVALGVAAVAVVALVVLALRQRVDRARRAVWTVAVVATVLEVTLQFLAAGGTVAVLQERRGLAALARLLVLVAVRILGAPSTASTAGSSEDPGTTRPGPGVLALSLVALATVPVAMPAAGGADGLLTALVTTVVLVAAVVAALLIVLRIRPATVLGIALLVLVAGPVAGVLIAPDPAVDLHAERLIVEGIAFDLTVAPVQPGRNEIHVYTWDEDGAPFPLERIDTVVSSAGGSTTSEMFVVAPNHHLSYALMLPEPGPWEVELSAARTDGALLTLRTTLELP